MNDPSFPGPEGKLNPLHLQLRAPRSHGSDRAWGLMLSPRTPPEDIESEPTHFPSPCSKGPGEAQARQPRVIPPVLELAKRPVGSQEKNRQWNTSEKRLEATF